RSFVSVQRHARSGVRPGIAEVAGRARLTRGARGPAEAFGRTLRAGMTRRRCAVAAMRTDPLVRTVPLRAGGAWGGRLRSPVAVARWIAWVHPADGRVLARRCVDAGELSALVHTRRGSF